MKKSKDNFVLSEFSHIYIEKDAKFYPNTNKILSKFKDKIQIEIDHYKDLFCRSRQNFRMQKISPKLILAVKRDNLVYEGAQVCEDFGNRYFYYTSSIMNCIYDCEYCYLQGMYPSANIVIFVNIEDIFREVEIMLKKHPVYLCISYDSDILALEGITSYVSYWLGFASKHKNLKIEIRTKSANFNAIKKEKSLDNVILAWTVSPDEIIKKYEIKTPSLKSRLNSIYEAIEKGWKVRICFDPLLYVDDWKIQYSKCIDMTFKYLHSKKIYDVSIGVFRISKDYLRKMEREKPYSKILAYPFKCQNGICSYSKEHEDKLKKFVYEEISKYVLKEKIYI
ncbi:SPL family radical SAM protein [Caminicella sporogenes]|uniref:SPL family radical SAM protein n=1 Tax=Caminicella sporogenes TaxID=166485 RepID=UPI00253F9E89|nr:radical SAM protein [Caminicella sporogenes]WIF94180.1 radical SAM protein [Caminicella sporogenes]